MENLQTQERRAAADETDELLFKRYQSGDAASFSLLYERVSPLLYTFIVARVSGDRSSADDILQQVWQKVFLKQHQFADQGPRSFRRWINTIAARQIIDARKGQKRHGLANAELGELVADDDSLSPEAALVNQEDLDSVRSCLEGLGESDSSILRMHTFDAMSYAEIARKLDIAEGTVGSRRSRAMQRLANCMESKI